MKNEDPLRPKLRSFSIGLDIGGTKIAGELFDRQGNPLTQQIFPTPRDYESLLKVCGELVAQFDKASGEKPTIGIGTAGVVDPVRGTVFAPNIPCLEGHSFRADCEKKFERDVHIANDANCAALAEALEGAGRGYRAVFGLIMGTGAGGGFVVDGRIYGGANGLAGEIGHLPLPMREPEDGPLVECGCGQKGCIDKSISGPALARLYHHMTGREIENPKHVVASLSKNDADARRVIYQFYSAVAKAMIAVVHTFDPNIIVVSGGLNMLPGLYDTVPKYMERYVVGKKLKTKFVPAKLGAMSGMRGAALVGTYAMS